MRHSIGGCCPMPMFFIWFKPNNVTGMDFLYRSTLPLHPSATNNNNKCLHQRMRVPCGSCARLESDSGTSCIVGTKEGIDTYRPGEPIIGALDGRLRTNS